MNLELQIKQRGRVLHSWPSKATLAVINPAMQMEAEHASAQLLRDGKMMGGYFDLVLLAAGREMDHEILIV